jgi:hypothetical protein
VLESVSETCIDLIFLLHLPNLQQWRPFLMELNHRLLECFLHIL